MEHERPDPNDMMMMMMSKINIDIRFVKKKIESKFFLFQRCVCVCLCQLLVDEINIIICEMIFSYNTCIYFSARFKKFFSPIFLFILMSEMSMKRIYSSNEIFEGLFFPRKKNQYSI